jgi:hypothetical protein
VTRRSPHRLESWATRRGGTALTLAIAALVLPSLVLLLLQPLHDDETAGGILDFELAGSVERTQEIVDSWRAEGVLEDAAFLHGLDFLYPLLYAVALAGGCLAAAAIWRRAGRRGLASWGPAAAWVAFVAAGFDYVENVALATALLGEPAAPWPQIAFTAAMLKFACITVALLYCVSGLLGAAAARSRSPTSETLA